VPTSYAGNTRLIYGAIQSAKGTPATTPTVVFRLTGDSAMDPGREIIQLPETDSSAQQPNSVVVGSSPVGGWGGWLRPAEFDWLAQATMGANADTGASDPWTHTATPTQAMPYVTLWDVIPGVQTTRYDDCRIGSLSASGEALQGIAYTVGDVHGLSATLGVTEPTAPTAPAAGAAMSYPNVTCTVGGATPGTFDSWSITVNRNITVLRGDLGLASYDSVPGVFAVEGTLRKVYASDADYRKFHGGSTGATTLTTTIFAEALSIAVVQSSSRSVTFTSSAVEYTETTVPVNVDGTPILQTMSFRTQRQATIANNLTIVTKNAKATPATLTA
jgi:hypothetical protein